MSFAKKILLGFAALVALALIGGGGYVGCQVSRFNSSMTMQYDVPVPEITLSSDPAVLARGQHLAESIGACIDCHGPDLSGKEMADMGPVGVVRAPNITTGKGGAGSKYSDGQLARLLKTGVTADNRGVVFMPSADFRWWPDKDIVAVISWLRQQPAVDAESEPSEIGLLGKVLDRTDMLPIDVARRIDHEAAPDLAPEPSPTSAYGAYLAKLCMGCHGPGLSGGPIPGAPPDMPIPTNLTPHETGLAAYDKEAFIKLLDTGVKPDGTKLDPFMPIATTSAMNDVEKTALWAYLSRLEARPFGGR